MKVSKKTRIIVDILLIILGVVFFIIGVNDAIKYFETNKITDAEKFHKSYKYVSEKESIYKYVSLKEVYNLTDKDSVIFIGKTTDPWAQVLAKKLNQYFKEKDTINYLELDDIKESDSYYLKVLDKLALDEFTSPLIVMSNTNGNISIYDKEKWYNPSYDGIPKEYFDDENNANLLEELLK